MYFLSLCFFCLSVYLLPLGENKSGRRTRKPLLLFYKVIFLLEDIIIIIIVLFYDMQTKIISAHHAAKVLQLRLQNR